MVQWQGIGAKRARDDVAIAQAEAPVFEKVTWYREPNMRKLYFYAAVLCVASATTGYDGQMLNASQLMNSWQDFFGNPTGGKLGYVSDEQKAPPLSKTCADPQID